MYPSHQTTDHVDRKGNQDALAGVVERRQGSGVGTHHVGIHFGGGVGNDKNWHDRSVKPRLMIMFKAVYQPNPRKGSP